MMFLHLLLQKYLLVSCPFCVLITHFYKEPLLNYEHTFAIDKKDKVVDSHQITLDYQFFPVAIFTDYKPKHQFRIRFCTDMDIEIIMIELLPTDN